jgi:hypothetical protein
LQAKDELRLLPETVIWESTLMRQVGSDPNKPKLAAITCNFFKIYVPEKKNLL